MPLIGLLLLHVDLVAQQVLTLSRTYHRAIITIFLSSLIKSTVLAVQHVLQSNETDSCHCKLTTYAVSSLYLIENTTSTITANPFDKQSLQPRAPRILPCTTPPILLTDELFERPLHALLRQKHLDLLGLSQMFKSVSHLLTVHSSQTLKTSRRCWVAYLVIDHSSLGM